MILQAHRGVSTEYPENTMPAFEAACRLGYPIIELDPGYTADGEIVVLHDKTLNRTCRFDDGRELTKLTDIREISYSEALKYDAGLWKDEQFRGTRIPLLKDALLLAKEHGVHVKIDNKFTSFPPEITEKLYSIVEKTKVDAGFTTRKFYVMEQIAERFPKSVFHYDGPVDSPALSYVKKIMKDNPLVVWLPIKSPLTSWVKIPRADAKLCALAKSFGKLGIWILETDDELRQAEALGADIVETTGSLRPHK